MEIRNLGLASNLSQVAAVAGVCCRPGLLPVQGSWRFSTRGKIDEVWAEKGVGWQTNNS